MKMWPNFHWRTEMCIIFNIMESRKQRNINKGDSGVPVSLFTTPQVKWMEHDNKKGTNVFFDPD